jgi:hypothetical protein
VIKYEKHHIDFAHTIHNNVITNSNNLRITNKFLVQDLSRLMVHKIEWCANLALGSRNISIDNSYPFEQPDLAAALSIKGVITSRQLIIPHISPALPTPFPQNLHRFPHPPSLQSHSLQTDPSLASRDASIPPRTPQKHSRHPEP